MGMTNRSQSDNVRAPKLRTKTFTGCWTCRGRRVKCDDERPVCRRCLRSGWVCQGYGLRLGWSPSPGTRSYRRQIWSSTPQSTQDLSSAAVTALLADLDGCSAEGKSHQRGPFSVFSATSSGSAIGYDNDHRNGTETSLSLPRVQAQPSLSSLPEKGDEAQHTPPPFEDVLRIHDETSDKNSSHSTPIIQLMTPTISLGNDAKSRESSLTSFENPDSLNENQNTAISTTNQYHISNPERRREISQDGYSPPTDLSFMSAINPVQLPRPETELVHHWVVFLSGNMLLIDTPDNPCRTIFMPMALKGLDAGPTESTIHLSIFHAICASSAFSLFHLRRNPRYQSLAMHHDQLALRHLRYNLQQARRLDEATLAAVLSCITAEAMSGRRSRWRTHVAGGLGLLENEVKEGWVPGPIASRLLQSYLSLSSLCNLPMSTQLIELLNGPAELRHYLERSHGITTPLVQFLAQITTMVDSKATISTRELDEVELQLYLNFPCLSTPNAPGSTIIQHSLNSFYYATIVFFRRTLRHARLSDVQELVEKAVHELEAVDALKNDSGGCAYNWASFVVAAECQRPDLQCRMLASFDKKVKHGIENTNILFEIVKTLWDRRAQAGIDVDIQWQEIAKEADFDIMLV
ncbi:uncharacterized protein N7469_003311 [Penicillium citrinum]|uniref:Zn(2)-C6 fungal-type domain-containing protein n=1 Tax=Penicillium citrinum TaxID=5077 RepID=A0A9W9TQ41_PENCI|nr:uncharacterized protein N7469_003311 [Penicillium citrinum]KAJ5234143.1 hypothetical protein N7469_003311 [Penicillium citrinum]